MSLNQSWKLGTKFDGNFTLTFAVAKVRYDGKNYKGKNFRQIFVILGSVSTM